MHETAILRLGMVGFGSAHRCTAGGATWSRWRCRRCRRRWPASSTARRRRRAWRPSTCPSPWSLWPPYRVSTGAHGVNLNPFRLQLQAACMVTRHVFIQVQHNCHARARHAAVRCSGAVRYLWLLIRFWPRPEGVPCNKAELRTLRSSCKTVALLCWMLYILPS